MNGSPGNRENTRTRFVIKKFPTVPPIPCPFVLSGTKVARRRYRTRDISNENERERERERMVEGGTDKGIVETIDN